jgi:hypothetical protein
MKFTVYAYTVALQQSSIVAYCIAKWALWKPGMPEYGGISRNMAEYHGIWRNIKKYHDIFPEYTGTSQYYLMVAIRLFINMDVWQHILLQKWWIFPILTVSNKQ